MAKNKKPHPKKRKDTKHLHLKFYIGLGVLFVLFSSAVLITSKNQSSRIASNNSARNSLQLDYFLPSNTPATPTLTPTPTRTPIIQIPTPTLPVAPIPTATPFVANYPPTSTPAPKSSNSPLCGVDDMLQMTGNCYCGHNIITCVNHQCVNSINDNPLADDSNICDPRAWVGSPPDLCPGPDGKYCMGKPVIYLYPEKDTLVNVSVKTGGKVVVSDPQYPDQGWQGILAHPNGQLEYQNKQYRELFYESESTTLNAPKKGIIIPTQNLAEKLRQEITLLGLKKASEQQEFLDWWVPRLQALHSPYILFSVLDASEKARVDNVEITPKPDTFIDFMAYFKPLSQPEQIEPLVITPAPERRGFTAIEWGGVIDHK